MHLPGWLARCALGLAVHAVLVCYYAVCRLDIKEAILLESVSIQLVVRVAGWRPLVFIACDICLGLHVLLTLVEC